jgi:tetratricopeptide (TPR) repeat protein
MASAVDPMTALGSLAGLLRRVAATPGTPPLPAGTVIGERYTVESDLGRGGMGVVYAVHDAELDDSVALKLLHPALCSDEEYRKLLRAEVRLARRVSHPNVCRVHDLGQDRGQLFVTMELVRGRSLRDVVRDGAIGLATAIDLVVQIASALTAAHRAGVLHRDVKPDNVVVDGHRAVLTDFGIASLAHDRDDNVIAGTPGYIAPEILRGEPADHRADVYSIAVVAYELACGGPPFAARTLDACRALAEQRPLPPPVPERVGAPLLRDALDRAFVRGLDPDPRTRIASAEQLAEAIAHAARAGASAPIVRDPSATLEPQTTPVTTTRRLTEVRVATALVYRADRIAASPSAGSAGEDLERIVVDLGGTPLDVGALEIAALFGVPVSLGDDAERAARAAQALIAHAGGRAGLDTVRVVFRPGSPALPTGDALDSAAALVRAAAAGEIVASPLTARQLARRFDLAPIDVGRGSARRVIGSRPAPRADAATYRSRELAALEALAEDSFARRRPRHTEVRAPAGYGKSQLRDALIARLRSRREIDWLVAQPASHADTPLGLLRAAHAEWYAAATRDGLGDRGAVFAAARRWLEARAERHPVALVVDDLQWADQLSRELIDDLATSLDDVPVFIAAFVRTTYGSDPQPNRPGVDAVVLGPLDPVPAGELVRALAPGAPAAAVDDVVRRAAGHPFFLEELARDLAERGGVGASSLPATIEAVVQARLDRLARPSLDVLAAAAVIGPVFWHDALPPMVAMTDDAIDAALGELERQGIVAPAPGDADSGGERGRFIHELVRDVAYTRHPANERTAMHATVAAWLARRFPALDVLASSRHADDVDVEIVAAFALHLEAAGDGARAAVAYRNAGTRYLAAAAYRDAALALRAAATLAPAIDRELAVAVGDAVLHAETIAGAETWYRRALAMAAADDVAFRALVWHKLGTAATRRADNAQAIACFEAGLALAAPGDGAILAPWATIDPRTAAMLFGSLGWVAGYIVGDNARGLAACRRAVDLLEGTPYRRDLAHALSRLGATLMRANLFRDQLACNRRNLEIGLEIGDLMMQLTARVNLGVVHGVLGEIDEAIEHTEIARTLAARSGARAVAGLIESNLAGLYLESGRLADAERCLDDGMVLADRAGSRAGLTETYGFAARIRAARGDLAAAERWASQALALAESLDLKLDRGIALRLLAQIRARAGNLDAARAAIADAAALVSDLDGFEAARTEAARARILERAGDHAAASSARAIAATALAALGARRELEALDVLDEVR